MNVMREIAEKVDISAVIERYGGVEIKRGKMFSCPFHGEDKNPSASIRKNNRWHCFACGEGGDAIDFVSKTNNVSAPDAAQILSDDFGLGISLKPVDEKERRKQLEEQKKWRLEKQKREEENERKKQKWLQLVRLRRLYQDAIRNWNPKNPEDLAIAPPLWLEAVKTIDYIDYLLDNFPSFT